MTSRPDTGIVHLGLGAFFRAHGAVYIQEAMAEAGGDWGVVGVSLRSPGVRDKLRARDWDYTLAEMGPDGMTPRTIDVLNDVLVAPEGPQAVLDALTRDSVKIVSLTVTEKGYCLTSSDGGLDLDHPDIAHDIANALPRSAPGYIVRAPEDPQGARTASLHRPVTRQPARQRRQAEGRRAGIGAADRRRSGPMDQG